MASVHVLNVGVLNNPCAFGDEFRFEVTFDCLAALSEDLEWRIVYVGSASNERYDQELENVLVGPVPLGTSKFILTAPAPDASRIPEDDILGATIVLITCWYKRQEVVRVGFWVNNTYNDEIPEGEEVPRPIDLTKVTRNVLADKPRVTRFNVEDWS